MQIFFNPFLYRTIDSFSNVLIALEMVVYVEVAFAVLRSQWIAFDGTLQLTQSFTYSKMLEL